MVHNKFIKIIKVNSNHVMSIFKWLNNQNIKKNLSSNIRVNFISKSLIKITIKRKDQMWYMIKYKEYFVGIIVFDDCETIDKICNIWYHCINHLLAKGIMTHGN